VTQNRQTRRFPRFQIRGVTGAVTAPRQAEVLDLSLGGALVEHQGQLRMGAPCFIDLPTNGSVVTIRCRVVHSGVSRRGPSGALYYCTGVKFVGLTPEAEEVLQAIIRSFGAPKDRRPRKKRSPRKSSGAM